MIKWPEKQCHGYFKSGKLIENDYEQGWNHCLDACRDAVEETCGREVLAKIIFESYWPGSKWEGAVEIDRESSYNVADAIRKHFGFEDAK